MNNLKLIIYSWAPKLYSSFCFINRKSVLLEQLETCLQYGTFVQMTAQRFDSWLILIFLSRIALYANFMVYAACLPILLDKWDMSATQAGSISSAFMFGYAASLFVTAWLSDLFGAKRLFLLSAFLSAFSALLFGFFAHSYLSGLFLYGLAASTQGGLYTPAIMLFSDRYDTSRRGTAVGYLIASTSVGYAFSLVVSGVCLTWGGYRTAFIVTGCLPVIGLGLVCVAKNPQSHSSA